MPADVTEVTLPRAVPPPTRPRSEDDVEAAQQPVPAQALDPERDVRHAEACGMRTGQAALHLVMGGKLVLVEPTREAVTGAIAKRGIR